MIGAGGGLVYLGLWAAAGPYGLLERRIGVLLLAACTVAVTLLALRHEIEGLAIWALAGAYMAPILLSPHVRSEEHTSELQSHHDLVCRLLLEKKKKEKKTALS